MWSAIRERKHTVTKVFPALFRDPGADDGKECELMLFGEVNLTTKDRRAAVVPWRGMPLLETRPRGARENGSLRGIKSGCKHLMFRGCLE